MKTLLAFLILLSISFNTKAKHNETLEFDEYILRVDGKILNSIRNYLLKD
tara:strand:- start:252 stop:401 length:150 start_codon:yes stop_codon:yes gene_type:complete